MVHKIEYNYNKIWHGIKANKLQICKSQLYNHVMSEDDVVLFSKASPKDASTIFEGVEK